MYLCKACIDSANPRFSDDDYDEFFKRAAVPSSGGMEVLEPTIVQLTRNTKKKHATPMDPNKKKRSKEAADAGEAPKKQFPWSANAEFVNILVHFVHKERPFAAKHGTTAGKWEDVALRFNTEFKLINLDGTLRRQEENEESPLGS